MSPLSIGGGGPHFPWESKKKSCLLYSKTTPTVLNKYNKNAAKYVILKLMISDDRNDL